ncbi:MAG: MMPL family transporter [Deltaproteobacteria bacterium]|nr:MMPL family transporter [Deltaproteobacteria bacterium]
MDAPREGIVVRIGAFLVRFRIPVILVILAITGVFGWKIRDIRVTSETIDLFPSTHPYVRTFVKYSEVFGGANTAVLAVEVKDGDIFNIHTLEKLRRITRAVEKLPHVNNYQVLSIAQRKVKSVKVMFNEQGRELEIRPIMWQTLEPPAAHPDSPRYHPDNWDGVYTEEDIALLSAEERDAYDARLPALKEDIYSSPRIFGTLVSREEDGKDSRAALVVVGFHDRKDGGEAPGAAEEDDDGRGGKPMTYEQEIYRSLRALVEPEEDANTEIHVIGRPVSVGFIHDNQGRIMELLGWSLLAIFLTLLLYFRDIRGVLVPIVTATLSAIWGLGFIGFLGYNFDPLVIVVPFIISARALSHSVQLIERYFEEYHRRQDRRKAAVATFAGLLSPGLLAIITDAAGVFLVILTPIPLMQKLAAMGGFWVLSFIVSDLLFNPVLLSFVPAPRRKAGQGPDPMGRLLDRVGGWCATRGRWAVVAVTVAVGGVGFYFARDLVIGDVHPGTPMLWPDSEYNRDTDRIAEKFGNTEILNVIVQGTDCPLPPREELLARHGCDETGGTCYDDSEKACTSDGDCFGCDPATAHCRTDEGRECHRDEDCVAWDCNPIKSPEVLRTMEALQRRMEMMPEVGGTASFASMIPDIQSAFASYDPKSELIPADRGGAGGIIEFIVSKAEPGDLTRYTTPDFQEATVTLYLRDHKGETLRAVIAELRDFIGAHPMAEAEFKLASGYGGLLAAVNEVITRAEVQVTFLAFLMVFICCAVAYRSVVAGFLFLIPLAVSNYVTYAVMGALEIGLDVNALPVVSLGVGLGVDYGLYIVSRAVEEYRLRPDMDHAIRRAVATAGKAVLFTATTMIAGVVFWAWSFLKFQADMGLLLAVWMCISMLGGLLLLPALIAIVKPRFITRAAAAKNAAGAPSH